MFASCEGGGCAAFVWDLSWRSVSHIITSRWMSSSHTTSDFRPAKILLRIEGLDGLPEQHVSNAIGAPKTAKVVRITKDGSPWPRSAPRALVRPVNWGRTTTHPPPPPKPGTTNVTRPIKNFVTTKICLSNFGESFDVRDPPEDLGIPQEYRAPEYVLDKRLGPESDIWALGCTLFEIRTGRRLFARDGIGTIEDDPDEHLARMAEVLGKFPEPWWSTTWEARRHWFGDELDAKRRPVSLLAPLPEEGGMARGIGNGGGKQMYTALDGILKAKAPSSRSIEDALQVQQARNPGDDEGGGQRLGVGQYAVTGEEVGMFANLLRRIFRYVPEQRIQPEEILEHAWFRM